MTNSGLPGPLDGWDVTGTHLGLAEYRADFRTTEAALTSQDSWKLQRRQHVGQPGTPSWEAFAHGQWDEALRLIEAHRPSLADS